MKKSLKIIALLAVLGVICFVAIEMQKQEEAEKPSEPQTMFALADRADMMVIASEGLGKTERQKEIGGRTYRNFVQLLKVSGVVDEQDTFMTDCKEGLRFDLYRDTTLVASLRMTDAIGREGFPGVWRTRKMAKVSKFLKDLGVNFVHCEGAAVADSAVETSAENQRPILTMPKFGASRKSKRNSERDASMDSIVKNATETSAIPDAVNDKFTNNVLNVLDEMILPSDTAVGKAIVDQLPEWNRAEVTFYKEPYARDSVAKKVVLNDFEFKELGELLKESRMETFAAMEGIYTLYSKVTLFKDSVALMELWDTSKNFEWFDKRPLANGENFESKGMWFSANPKKISGFFARVGGLLPSGEAK